MTQPIEKKPYFFLPFPNTEYALKWISTIFVTLCIDVGITLYLHIDYNINTMLDISVTVILLKKILVTDTILQAENC